MKQVVLKMKLMVLIRENTQLLFGKIIEEQIMQYKHYVNGDCKTYVPFEVK